METPPNSEGGVSRGEGTGAGGGASNINESFHEIPEPARHELLLLLRVEQEDGRPLPVGTYTECCVNLQIVQWTGINPVRMTHINPLDTVVEFTGRSPNCCCGAAASHDQGMGGGTSHRVMHHG